MDKVHGGTPQGSRSLCATCRMAHNLTGLNFQQETYCGLYGHPRRINFPIATCSFYDDKRVPSLYQMQQIAWNVTSRKRGPTGFSEADRLEVHIDPPNPIGEQLPVPPITG
jgi:hypothetical protein